MMTLQCIGGPLDGTTYSVDTKAIVEGMGVPVDHADLLPSGIRYTTTYYKLALRDGDFVLVYNATRLDGWKDYDDEC